jgi:ketosteroid isomerase-like protein
LRQVWAELDGEILEVVDSGQVVVSVIRWHLRGHSGIELDEVEGWVTHIRDGKITPIDQCGGKAEALQAAGLSE